jgi:hypothetical protein
MPISFVFQLYFRKIFTFRPLEYLNITLDPKLGATANGAELTRLGTWTYGTELGLKRPSYISPFFHSRRFPSCARAAAPPPTPSPEPPLPPVPPARPPVACSLSPSDPIERYILFSNFELIYLILIS